MTGDLRTRVEELCDAAVPVLPGGPPMWASVNLIRAVLDADLEDLDAKSSERPSDVSDGLPDTPTTLVPDAANLNARVAAMRKDEAVQAAWRDGYRTGYTEHKLGRPNRLHPDARPTEHPWCRICGPGYHPGDDGCMHFERPDTPTTEHVCPDCKVERADYEGPGQHLPVCPNCGSTATPRATDAPVDRASESSDALLVEQIARIVARFWDLPGSPAKVARALVVARPWQAEVEAARQDGWDEGWRHGFAQPTSSVLDNPYRAALSGGDTT